MRYQAGLTIAAISVAVAAASPAHAHSGGSHFLLRGDVMAPPAGFVDMCRTDATFCQIQVDAPPSPPPAFRDGRGATGLPAFAMTVTNMIARSCPTSSTAWKARCGLLPVRAVARGADLSVVPRLSPIALDDLRDATSRRIDRSAHNARRRRPLSGRVRSGRSAAEPWRVQPVLTGKMPLLVGETVWCPRRDRHRARSRPGCHRSRSGVTSCSIGQQTGQQPCPPRPDIQIYATAEHWDAQRHGHGAQGDCEDLAIEKRFQLIAQGSTASD